jgi:hypothetical protein
MTRISLFPTLVYAQKMRLLICCAAYLSVFIAAAAPERSAEFVNCTDIPAAVRKSAASHIAGSSMPPACERITEDRNILFEVKVITRAGRMQEWVYRPDGSLKESEEKIPAAEAPAAAREAIRRAVGNGQLRKIDKIQRGRQVLYEGEYAVDGVKRKVIVDASGRVKH